jgi:hypothetical protein
MDVPKVLPAAVAAVPSAVAGTLPACLFSVLRVILLNFFINTKIIKIMANSYFEVPEK